MWLRAKSSLEGKAWADHLSLIWPATRPSGESRYWPLGGTAQRASWAGKSEGSTCGCAPNCPGNRKEDEHRERLKRNMKQTNPFHKSRACQQESGVVGKKHMREDSPRTAPTGSTERISAAFACGTDGRWPSLSTWDLLDTRQTLSALVDHLHTDDLKASFRDNSRMCVCWGEYSS